MKTVRLESVLLSSCVIHTNCVVATTMQIATDIVKEAGGMNTITTTYNMGTFRGFAATLDNE